MTAKETIDEILNGKVAGEELEELTGIIANEIDDYIKEDNFTKLPIGIIYDIASCPCVSDDKIEEIINILIKNDVKEAPVLLNAFKISDNDVSKCFKILSLFKESKVFACISKWYNESRQDDNSSKISYNITNNKIYVGDLPETTDEEFLRNLFAEYGSIPQNGIILKKSLDKAFAFITFETHESAESAIKELNYTKIDDVPIRVSWSDPETKKYKQSGLGNLFVSGLDDTIDVSQLHEAFSKFGEIISCKIPTTSGKSRGYGYVQFRNPSDAENARITLQGTCINDKEITIQRYHN
jgi:polyadenylate-binding protein